MRGTRSIRLNLTKLSFSCCATNHRLLDYIALCFDLPASSAHSFSQGRNYETMATKAYKIIILGGGIAGLAAALALTKFASPEMLPTIEVYEVRPEPGTIGGALSLTPNAPRVLEHLGVYSIIESRNFGISVDAIEVFNIYQPTKLTELSFSGPKNTGVGKPPYKVPSLRLAKN